MLSARSANNNVRSEILEAYMIVLGLRLFSGSTALQQLHAGGDVLRSDI